MVSRSPLPPPPAPPFAFIPSMKQLRVPELIDSVREVESGSRENRTSRKGALGPMQVMPETLKNPGYGMEPATDYSQPGLDRFGQEYLQRMIRHYGDVRDALVAYNWGPGNANKWIRRGRKEAALPRETRDYLNKVGLDYAQRVKGEPSPPAQTAAVPLPPPPAPPAPPAPPVQTAAVPAPAPVPDTPSPVPPPAAPDEPAQDWMASAFYGPTLSRAEGREDRRADDALSLFQTAQRFLSPAPRTVAQRGSYAEGGEVDLATIAAGGSGPDEEMRQGLGSLVDRARAMFPAPSDAPLFDDTGYERGTVLPLRRNIETGKMEFATPGLISEPLNAMQRSVAAARSGQQVQPGDVAEALGLVGATSLALPRSVTQVPAGALGAMKPRGGNWLTDSVDDALDEVIASPKEMTMDLPPGLQVAPRMVEISKWIHGNFKKYVLRDMATPEDPVRKAIDEGVKFGNIEDYRLGTIEQYQNIIPSSKLKKSRAQSGFPEEGFATTPQGKTYEIFTDAPVMSFKKKQLLDPDFADQDNIPEWVEKLNPRETVYKLDEYAYSSITDIAEPLANALIRATDPQTDLPINLRVNPDSVKRMSVKDVFKLTSDIDAFRRAEADKAVMAAAKEAALVNKVDDFDLKFSKGKGGAWLELPSAETSTGLNVCTKLGAAGGWCTMQEGYARNYTKRGKLYVLVDGDGRPHIQIYEKPSNLPKSLQINPGAKEIAEIKFPENEKGGRRSEAYIEKDPEYVSKTSKAVVDFLNSRNIGYVNESDLQDLRINGRLVIDRGLESKPRFVVKGDETPRPYAEGGAVRVPEGEPDETASGVGSLAGRARAMFEVEPLDYRPAARGARAAAERLGEELSAPGRVPAPDVRQQLERMARDALEAGKVAGEVGYELMVPQDLTDVALMALMGPGARVGGKVLRRGVGATLMALDPEEVVLEESAVKNYANGGEVHSGVGSLAPAARNMTRRTA